MSEYARNAIKQAMTGADPQRLYFLDRLGKEIADVLIDCGIARTCLNCESWNDPKRKGDNPNIPEGCKKYRMMPPPKVLVVGCEHHSDVIPF